MRVSLTVGNLASMNQRFFDFTDRVVVVSGAAKGIGAGIAHRFACAGAVVVANYRSSERQARALKSRIEQDGGRVHTFPGDVTREGDVTRLFDDVLTRTGRLDVLINNAGSYPMTGVLEMTADEWDAVLATNLRSVFLCTQAAARRMPHGGAIINIASIEGESPMPLHSHYNAAKAGVLMHTLSAARELGPHGIRVNAVSPGLIWREGIERDWPDGVQRWTESCPLGTLGTSDDVANACLFFASDAARWITGVNLRVDGGAMTRPAF